MNPVDSRDAAIARYLDGPALLERAVAGLTEAELDAGPSDGGWTIRQIVHHVVDGDDLWKVGLKAALGRAPDEFTLAWYWGQQQEIWAARWAYADRTVDVSMALLGAIRRHVSQLLETIPDAWSASVRVRKADGEIVPLSVEALVNMQADHLEHHVGRIAAIRRERDGV